MIFLLFALVAAWLLAACAVVAAVLGVLGLRRGLNSRRIAWAFGWLVAPWVLVAIVGGPDFTGLLVNMIGTDMWWAGLPMWIWTAVAASLTTGVIVSIVRGNVAANEPTRLKR